MHLKKATSVFVSILLTVIALTYALWNVELQELLTVFSDVKYSALFPFLGLLVVFFWLKAFRWALILRPLDHFTLRQVTPALMIGFAANNVLPARLGELLRAIIFARRFRKPFSGVFATVGIDRICDVGAILAIYLVATLILGDLPEAVKIGAMIGAALMIASIIALVLILQRLHIAVSIWRVISSPLPVRYSELGESILQNISEAASTLKSPRLIGLLITNSLCQWSIMTLNVWLAIWAFGATISLGAALFVMVVTALAVSIPSIPGYIGPIQAAFVFALSPFGIAPETAFAGSVFFLVVQWVPVTIAGALFFVFSGASLNEVRSDAEQVDKRPRLRAWRHDPL